MKKPGLLAMTDSEKKVQEAIEALRNGEMVILMDDHERENEGDLCMVAEKVTPQAIAFMATHGRGLICLALTPQRTEELHLPLMVRENRSKFGTNFTISIDAREGITTGISAADRARTIQVAVSPETKPQDLVSPGHIFPLRSAMGGVLERAGQTEGAVDLAKLAGYSGAGVICEIMKEDGTMARKPELEEFARKHNLKMLEIADIIRYRISRESLIQKVMEKDVKIRVGDEDYPFKMIIFKSKIHDCPREYLVLVHGKVDDEPILCRVHQGHISLDLFGIKGPRKQVSKDESLRMIVKEGKGVFIFFPPKETLIEELGGREEMERVSGLPASQEILREFGMGAQILVNLGVKQIRLITRSPKKLYGLDGFGLKLIENISPP